MIIHKIKVADPKLFISHQDQDPTCQVITDPYPDLDPTCWVIMDPDPDHTCQVNSDLDPNPFRIALVK